MTRRVMLGLAMLALAGCAPIAIASAIASSAVSRAQGQCYARCIASTECDTQTGLCRPIRRPEDIVASVPSAAPPTTVVPVAPAFDEPAGGFDCRTESGWSDEVIADSPTNAATVCQELSGETCTCVSSVE